MDDAATVGESDLMTEEFVTRPARWLSAVGVALIVICVGCCVVVAFEMADATTGGGERTVLLLVLVVLLVAGLAGVQLAATPLRVSVTPRELVATYWPIRTSVPLTQVTQVRTGDGAGFGYGWGYRWEGRGARALRIGGPMATVEHGGGRLSLSVADPEQFVAAVERAQRGQGRSGRDSAAK